MRGFRSHAIKFDNLEVPSLLKLLHGWRSDLEPAEIKSVKASADPIELFF
jgi:hypothetical protein